MSVAAPIPQIGKKEIVFHPEKGYPICGSLKHKDRRAGIPQTRWNKPVISRSDICLKPAGSGTDHKGIGHCKDHGGRNETYHSLVKNYGLQAQITLPEISSLIERLKNDRDVFDFTEHIYVMEALAIHLINGGDFKGSAKVWSEITKAYERLHNIQVGRKYVMTVVDVSKILEQFADIIDRRVFDSTLKSVIGEDLAKITLPSSRPVTDPSRILEAARFTDEEEG